MAYFSLLLFTWSRWRLQRFQRFVISQGLRELVGIHVYLKTLNHLNKDDVLLGVVAILNVVSKGSFSQDWLVGHQHLKGRLQKVLQCLLLLMQVAEAYIIAIALKVVNFVFKFVQQIFSQNSPRVNAGVLKPPELYCEGLEPVSRALQLFI